MTLAESRAFRPKLEGWSDDILPFYRQIARELPNPCKVVEIGSAKGRSAIFLASELLELGHTPESHIYLVDSWPGQSANANFHGASWFQECLASILQHGRPEELDLLYPLRLTSEEASRIFTELDMVFIDGDHTRIACERDIRNWRSAVGATGILAGHDYDEHHPGVREAVDKCQGLGQVRVWSSVWRMQ